MDTVLPRKIERVPVGTLVPYPGNSRRGDINAIRESLRENKQFRAIAVQKSTNRVVYGNQTLFSAVEEGWEEIDVVFLDIDDDQAEKINLADNRLGDLAHDDDTVLLPRLEKLQGRLDGTGFKPLDVDELRSRLKSLDPPDRKVPSGPMIACKVGTIAFTLTGDEWATLLRGLQAAAGLDPAALAAECKNRLAA